MKSLAILLLLPTAALANNLECLTRVIYRESLGAHVEAVAINAKATINRATNGNVCLLINQGIVKAAAVPINVKPYFTAIAKTAMETKHDISDGADAWNTGKRPRQPGSIKRVAGGQVFYKRTK